MSAIAISYRRQDTRWAAGRIRDHLALAFGSDSVFEDVVSIPLGVDFRTHIGGVIAQARVVLVLIGRGWLDAKLESGERRLTVESDHVRVEVESALASSARVIPVLIDDAAMPSSAELPKSLEKLAFLNGIRVRPDPDFKNDLGALITAIRGAMEGVPRPTRENRLVEVQPDAHSRAATVETISKRAALFHLHGPHAGRVDELRDAVTIGRSDKADLVIESDSVSRLHARISSPQGFQQIVDLGSTNGTFVNGSEIVGRHRLNPGDVIYVGSTVIEFLGGWTYEDRLKELSAGFSSHDGLTWLANKAALSLFLRQDSGPMAVLALRIEGLERLVERHGLPAQNVTLRAVARALASVAPPNGCLSRLEGGRFCLAVPRLNLDEARALGARMQGAVEDLVIRFEEEDLEVTLGLGAVARTAGPYKPRELIEEAGSDVTGSHHALKPEDEQRTLLVTPEES